MELIPAIDLLGGRVVRLTRGDYDAATEYSDDPVAQAKAFAKAGAKRLHVVDLDGARLGRPENLEVIRAILAYADVRVQVGGGIREIDVVERWLGAGADRVVLGTMAVRDPELARDICESFPDQIVIAIDARGDDVAIEGWREATKRHVRELAEDADAWGAAAILYTDIARDGTGEGPAVERTAALQQGLRASVIASGGIGSIAHVRALREAGVRAAVCGRALYAGAVDLKEALAVAEKD